MIMGQLTKRRVEEVARIMRGRKIVVLGDVMLDEFVWGDVTRISPEAPVPVVDIRRESVHLGGAANVLAILAAVLPLAYKRVPVLIDPKLRNFASYRPATLVTPNHHEALRMTNLEEDSDGGLYQAARLIRSRLNCDAVLITRGDRGMILLE